MQKQTTEWKEAVAIHIYAYDTILLFRIHKELQVNFLKVKHTKKPGQNLWIETSWMRIQIAKEHIQFLELFIVMGLQI